LYLRDLLAGGDLITIVYKLDSQPAQQLIEIPFTLIAAAKRERNKKTCPPEIATDSEGLK
jgi:hypothetical protein